MTNKKGFTLSVSERRSRRFSDNFKKSKVREIEKGLSRVIDISKQYEVGCSNIYKWIATFGSMKKKTERVILEIDSDTKELLSLKKRIAELERVVGQKQIQLEFKDKMIEIAEQTYGIDIKKKFGDSQLNTTIKTETK